jgi:hypothetical protein
MARASALEVVGPRFRGAARRSCLAASSSASLWRALVYEPAILLLDERCQSTPAAGAVRVEIRTLQKPG